MLKQIQKIITQTILNYFYKSARTNPLEQSNAVLQ